LTGIAMGEKRPFLLRLSPELYELLRRWAESELRSVNGQVEWILRDAVERRMKAPAQKKPGK
jgi:hypothetical protein